ncbi:hypothetical protein Bca101_081278 [Brassica carinata]
MLELVIAELRAGDYRSRMPDAAAKKRTENKYFELVGEKIGWDPEISNKIGYLRKLWSTNGQLIKRTGISVDQSTGQINMMQTWWANRIAEYGSKGKFVSVLQKQPLPFKDLLDQIFGEHGVEHDERYSPHMLGQHLQQIKPSLAPNDDTIFDQMQEDQIEATRENNGVHMHQSENASNDENDVQGNEETSTAVYMKIVPDQIAKQLWSDKRLGSRRV